MSETVAAFLLRHDSGRVAELLPVRYRRMQDNALAHRAALAVRKDFRAFRAS